jgi:putative cell wall-binding protein
MKHLLIVASLLAFVSCAEETTVNDQITDSVTVTDSTATDSTVVEDLADEVDAHPVTAE